MRSNIFLVDIKIKGTHRALENFRAYASGFDVMPLSGLPYQVNDFCFNNFVSLENKILKTDSYLHLSKVRSELWLCDSNALNTELLEDDHSLTYKFATLDGYPRPVIEAMIRNFTELRFEILIRNPRQGLKLTGLSKQGKFYSVSNLEFQNEIDKKSQKEKRLIQKANKKGP